MHLRRSLAAEAVVALLALLIATAGSARADVTGSILGIAANQHRVWAGGTLLGVYSLGLGLPFLVTGLAIGRLGGALAWVKRHFALIVGGSAVMLGAFGVLLMFNELSRLSLHLQNALTTAHLDWLVNLG